MKDEDQDTAQMLMMRDPDSPPSSAMSVVYGWPAARSVVAVAECSQPPDSQMSLVYPWPAPSQCLPPSGVAAAPHAENTNLPSGSSRKSNTRKTKDLSVQFIESSSDDSANEHDEITSTPRITSTKSLKTRPKGPDKSALKIRGPSLFKPSNTHTNLKEISPQRARRIAILHQDNNISHRKFALKRELYEAQGITWPSGPWSAEEDLQLRHNFANFFQEHEVDDPMLYLNYSRKTHLTTHHKKEIKRNIDEWGFYTTLGYGIERPLHVIYCRAREMLHPQVSVGKFSDAEKNILTDLISKYGPQWAKIGIIMDRQPQSCRGVGRYLGMLHKTTITGTWTPTEDERLIRVMSDVAGVKALSNITTKWPFRDIAKQMDGRNHRQVEDRWLVQLHNRFVVAVSCPPGADVLWSSQDKMELIRVVAGLGCSSRRQIDWSEVALEMGRYNKRFLQIKFSDILKHHVPGAIKNSDNVKVITSHIVQNVFPEWSKREEKARKLQDGISVQGIRELLQRISKERREAPHMNDGRSNAVNIQEADVEEEIRHDNTVPMSHRHLAGINSTECNIHTPASAPHRHHKRQRKSRKVVINEDQSAVDKPLSKGSQIPCDHQSLPSKPNGQKRKKLSKKKAIKRPCIANDVAGSDNDFHVEAHKNGSMTHEDINPKFDVKNVCSTLSFAAKSKHAHKTTMGQNSENAAPSKNIRLDKEVASDIGYVFSHNKIIKERRGKKHKKQPYR